MSTAAAPRHTLRPSPRQSMRPLSPESPPAPASLMTTLLPAGRQWLIVVSICVSLMICNAAHLFIHLLAVYVFVALGKCLPSYSNRFLIGPSAFCYVVRVLYTF